MQNRGTLKVATRRDREIVMTRVFEAPAESYDKLAELLAELALAGARS
jgi:hypothetical protein